MGEVLARFGTLDHLGAPASASLPGERILVVEYGIEIGHGGLQRRRIDKTQSSLDALKPIGQSIDRMLHACIGSHKRA